jgi:flagellar biosynthesis/type III secretory pathway chaperone
MASEFDVLERLLQEETHLVAAFLSLLEAEALALNQSDGDRLESVLGEKSTALKAVQDIESQRHALFAQLAIAPAGAKPDFSFAGERAALLDQCWSGLADVVSKVRAQHEVNGQLIAAYQQKTNAALGVLLSRRGEFNLYDSAGLAAPAAGRRIVDSA